VASAALFRFAAPQRFLPLLLPMPMPVPPEASDYVLLHRDTGLALYRTRATEEEIARANSSLSRAGQRSRFVTVRHLMHHQPTQES
jgi:hypothetical protein